MTSSHEDYAKVKRSYLWVGGALFFFTFVTVGTAKLWHPFGPVMSWRDVVLGLVIASFKSLLVALIFMHLNHERGLIYKVLLFTFYFFVGLMGLTLFALFDPIREGFDAIFNRLNL